MKKYPKISIVTPVYNQAEFIEKTILSVIEQNYPNLEYIIIDGGSTDGTVDIIKKYEKYLSYWISEPDNGHADALNKGFSKATGEIMAWINGDDMYFPWTFETVAEIFTQFPEIQWLSGAPTKIDKYGKFADGAMKKISLLDYLVHRYEWIQQESVFWRKKLWLKAGGYINEKYKLMIDGELWSRFFEHTELYYTEYFLAGYRIHEKNRAYLNIDEIHNEMDKIIENLKKTFKNDYEILEKYLTLRKISRKIPMGLRLYNKLYDKIILKKLSIPITTKTVCFERNGKMFIKESLVKL